MAEDSNEKKVVVRIYGEDYPITGADDPAYISKIADLVDSRMKDIAAGSRVKSRDKVAILTAMSMASELYEKTELLDSSDGQVSDKVDRIISQLEQALSDR
ncbi:MAG: cell division protein ZapA [candidate division Zixibacteria bacterium]|nr:cell division protein ZapA [candidate division Zixibacteria bacterium]